MNIKKTIILALMAISSLTTMAQSTVNSADAQYNEAQALYDNGDFEKCEEDARGFVSTKKGMVKTSTYKLMALCRIAEGDIEGAKTYIEKLLKNDPYYAPSFGDPQRFIDIVNEFKNQEAGITTASRQSESLGEAPVPVTLITEDMIHYSGCQSLQELLCLYVPGMTLAEGAETNIAMHGIYSLMQDKILIMVDGHRLNSSSTNAEAPDFRNSLDKIQQIEVLRGPASSLYGNCALTAVVNIITRKGAAMNGGRISATVGTQGSYGADIVVGGGNGVLDLMGWGSFYATRGFASEVENGLTGDHTKATLYAHGYNRRPSYDIGMKGRWKDFTMSLNIQSSKMVPYMNILQMSNNFYKASGEAIIYPPHIVGPALTNAYQNYDYDKYQSIGGNGPGVTRNNIRIDIDYKHSFEKIDIEASGYLNFEKTELYNVMGDSVEGVTSSLMLLQMLTINPETAEEKALNDLISKVAIQGGNHTNGVLEKMDWSGVTYGMQAQATVPYRFLGEGSVVVGTQFELFSLSSNNLLLSGDYSGAAAVYSNSVFKEGSEYSISGFVQWKHKFPCNLIFNTGLRYDHKQRYDENTLDRFSPRFSLIYKLNDRISFRGNYNYSFVDAPYIYRACILKVFSGGPNMKPETMHSFNLSANYSNKKKHLMADLGVFYNILNDLCILNPHLGDKNGSSYLFVNTGRVRTIGVEGSAQLTRPRFFANMNATWQRIVTSDKYISYNSQTYSTPEFHTNLTVALAPYYGTGAGFFDGGKLWLRTTIQFQTATHYPTIDLMSTYASSVYDVYSGVVREMRDINPQCVVGLGVTYDWKHIDIDLSLKNLFNNEYKVGSMLMDGVPRAGRQFLAKLTYKF